MNEGRVEQSGSADELYEHPANEFVMSFVGEVNRLGDHFVRPHDMEVVLDPDERTQEGLVQRIVTLGFEVRVELVLSDGTEVWAQLTRAELQRLELREGQIAYLRPIQAKSFNGSSPSDSQGASTPPGPRTAATQGICSRLKGRRGGASSCRVTPRPNSPRCPWAPADFQNLEAASRTEVDEAVAVAAEVRPVAVVIPAFSI